MFVSAEGGPSGPGVSSLESVGASANVGWYPEIYLPRKYVETSRNTQTICTENYRLI